MKNRAAKLQELQSGMLSLGSLFKISFALSLLLIASSLSFYFLYYLPHQNALKAKASVECDPISMSKAQELLQNKASLPDGAQYKAAAAKGLAIREDIDYYFQQCLKSKGITY